MELPEEEELVAIKLLRSGAADSGTEVHGVLRKAPGFTPRPSGRAAAAASLRLSSQLGSRRGCGQESGERLLASTDAADASLPGAEFRIVLRRTGAGSVAGLDLDPQDGVTAVVTAVRAGLVLAWNITHKHLEVRPNDRILSVNGERGDASKLLERLRHDTQLTILLRRPREFRVSVAAKRNLGMTVSYAPQGTSLVVDVVNHRGLLQVWNNANPGREVMVHDRIVEVNGVRGPPERLLRELNSLGALELLVFR